MRENVTGCVLGQHVASRALSAFWRTVLVAHRRGGFFQRAGLLVRDDRSILPDEIWRAAVTMVSVPTRTSVLIFLRRLAHGRSTESPTSSRDSARMSGQSGRRQRPDAPDPARLSGMVMLGQRTGTILTTSAVSAKSTSASVVRWSSTSI
jgi:hypothetical protein